MTKKSIMTLLAVMTVAGFVGASTINAEAAGLTQASSADEVQYGTLTEEDTNLLKTMFDFDYYKAQNPDLVEALGDNYNNLFEHFCKCGIFEGRTCNENFDPAAYASAYPDLKEIYGNNIAKYYVHYGNIGSKEGRDITTIKACADAGITVQSLVSETSSISPAAYVMCERLGLNDYTAMQQVINEIIASNKSNGQTNGAIIESSTGTYILAKDIPDPEAYAKAKGLTVAATVRCGDVAGLDVITGNGVWTLYLYSNNNADGTHGYAWYNSYTELSDATLVCSTEGFTPILDDPEDLKSVADGDGYWKHRVTGVIVTLSGPADEAVSMPQTTPGQADGDFTNAPIFEYNRTNPEDGVTVGFGFNDETFVNEESMTGTATTNETRELVGYYEDADGEQPHYFADETEKSQYYSTIPRGVDTRAYSYEERALDTDGHADTEYTVTAGFEVGEDGVLESFSVGVYNDENEFGAVEYVEPDMYYSDGTYCF